MLPRTLELNAWTSEKKCRQLVENLTRKHFTAVYCATAQEAADYILKQAEGAASLLPDQVAPAYVWDIRLGPDGAVRAGTVYRAMVRSVLRTDYETVQQQVDAGTAEGTLALLADVGPLRIERELARGGASLPMPEQEVLRDDDGTYSLRFRPPLPSEEWNAQISLLTGMVAADIMLRHRVGILRTG